MSNSLTSGLKKAFFTIIALLSAATTFLYFVTAFSFGDELLGQSLLTQILTGAWGVIVLDAAAVVWLRIYLTGSDNNSLRAIAVAGMIIGLVGSALTSFLYIVSSSNNVALPPVMAEASVWGLAGITCTHFVLAFLSGYKSTSAQIDERTAAMLSEATDEMLTLTEQEFRNAIPHLARANAAHLTQQLAGRFASLTEHDARPRVTNQLPPPSDNGWRPYPAQQSGNDQQNVNPPNGSPARDATAGDVQERFHTVFSDVHGDTPISTDLSRDEFAEAIAAAERAKREGNPREGNPTNGQNGRH